MKPFAKAAHPVAALLLLSTVFLSAAPAGATSFVENSVYTLQGGIAGYLENRLDGDTRFDQFIALEITGTVTTGAQTLQQSLDLITVSFTVTGGHFFDVNFDAAGNPSVGAQVGTVDAGAEGALAYNNAAIIFNANGDQGAAVYTDSVNPNAPVPLGDGGGTLGIAPQEALSGELNGTAFQNAGVALQGKSQLLLGTAVDADYRPFSQFGSFMASFGEHDGLGFSFHAWLMNTFNSFLGISTEFDVFLDVHASLSPAVDPPPTEVPEPASLLLLGSALAGGALRIRRR